MADSGEFREVDEFVADFEEVVKLDTEYITNWSMGRDFKIIFKTIGVIITGDGAK